MKKTEFNWTSNDGIPFYGVNWTPESETRAVIALVHGHGEHSNRYAHVAAFMADRGIALIGFDHRGHGKTGGKRGHTPSYEQFMLDIDQFLKEVEKQYPGIPVFLYGHSMGGNIATNYLIQRQPKLAGAVISAPWYRLPFAPPAFQVFLARVMNFIFPSLTQATNLDANGLSKDPEVVKTYQNDPLVHGLMSARLFLTAFEAGEEAIRQASKIKVPMLLYHGDKDPITSYAGSEAFSKAAGDIVTFKGWPGLLHETHNEPEKEQVLGYFADWVEKNLS